MISTISSMTTGVSLKVQPQQLGASRYAASAEQWLRHNDSVKPATVVVNQTQTRTVTQVVSGVVERATQAFPMTREAAVKMYANVDRMADDQHPTVWRGNVGVRY